MFLTPSLNIFPWDWCVLVRISLNLFPRIRLTIASHSMMTSSNGNVPRNWPFVRGIHRSPVNSSHKGQLRGALMFSLICVWINDWACWVKNREAGDLRRHRTHYDVIVMHCFEKMVWPRKGDKPFFWTNDTLVYWCIHIPYSASISVSDTVRCRYIAVIFIKLPHNIHPIAHPSGRVCDVCCEFQFWSMFCCCHCGVV